MNGRAWNALVVGAVIFFMDPLSAATDAARRDTPWPALLSAEPAAVDPHVAALQRRANVALERLLSSAHAPG
jgi:hypothetical protein